ncbi:MAG: hypothetical protein J5800_03595 [Spirochaetales bacterium]|nr:hypothetical protein [Spirochaetales bacterium]
MFNRQKHYENAIQKVTIRFGKALNLPEGEDCYVTFREPAELEVLKLRTAQGDAVAGLETIRDILIDSVVDHDFYDDDKTKMTSEEVVKLLYEKVLTADILVKEYTHAVFHSQVSRDEGK